jgi:predicted branched-subunit amino acid permease
MTEHPEAPGDGPDGIRTGLRVGAGLAAGSFALAVTFGAFAVTHGWPAGLAVLMSLLAFSGSAQFALVTTLPGGGLGPALAAATLLNLRFVPLSAAIAGSLAGGPWRRALEGQAVVDGSWVSARRPDGTFDRAHLLTASLVQWPAWAGGTALGALAVPSTEFVRTVGLDLVFPGFYLVLLLDALSQDRRLIPVSLGAVAVAAGACRFLPVGAALLLASLAALWALVDHGTAEPR